MLAAPFRPSILLTAVRRSTMVTTRGSTRAATSVPGTSAIADSDVDDSPRPAKRSKTITTTDEIQETTVVENSASNKRKNTSRLKEEPMPEDYRARVSSEWKVGAHVSSAGGVENAIQNAAQVGANSFALFLKSQRKWSSPPLRKESIATFKSRMVAFGYLPSHVLPHGSYLINLGNPDQEKREKSYDCFLDDLQRCEQLGLELYNFHPGSTVGQTTLENSITLIAECLNRAHKATHSVVTVIENMAGAGNIIGSTFGDLAGIIHQVEDKSRVGVCIDTCHLFAAGYDIRTKEGWESTVSDFDTQVGLSYLRGIHLNDSKALLGSQRDRHENIGLGQIGLSAFRHILADPRLQNMPIVLETPSFESTEIWTTEVEVLNQLSHIGDAGEDQTAMAEMKAKIEDVVKSATNGPKATAQSGKVGLGKSKARTKRGQ